MDFEEYKLRLSAYIVDDVPDADAELSGPFANFFGNTFLLLLYHCKHRLSPKLEAVREAVRWFADSNQPEKIRGAAAMALAEVSKYARGPHDDDNDAAYQGFVLQAAQWKNVTALRMQADELLARAGLAFAHDPDVDLLPRMGFIHPERKQVNDHVERAGARERWQTVTHIAIEAAESGFEAWQRTEIEDAIFCVVAYIAIPADYVSERVITEEERVRLALWAAPLMRKLLGKYLTFDKDKRFSFLETAKRLKRQARTLILALTSPGEFAAFNEKAGASKAPGCGDTQQVHQGEEIETAAAYEPAPGEAATVVVIRGTIPPSADRDDRAQLSRYEALRKPLPLAAMPSREKIALIQETLAREFPWATGAINVIMSEIRARKRFGSKVLGMQPVLLVGPPGTGKTRLSQRLAGLLGIPNTVINLAGMTDNKTLKGVTRGWSSNRPSRIVESILSGGPSHLFLLDEVDKARGNGIYSGEPQEALLDLLEPANARRYGDVYLQTECDISHSLYILTSNSLERISEPLLSRLSLAYVPPPGPEHFETIVGGVLRDIEKSWRVPTGVLQLSQIEIQLLRGLAPRDMRRAVLAILGDDDAAKKYTLH